MTKSQKKVPFGFETVSPDEKTTRVKDVFSRVASKYDVMNDAMSLFQHRIWKEQFIKQIPLKDGDSVIDVSSGSGDIARKLFKKAKKSHTLLKEVALVDPNPEMLQTAKDRFIDQGLLSPFTFTEAPAENLPFSSSQFDVYTISFGLRNVTDRAAALKEAMRVLKPGGQFFCLEFSQPKWPGLDTLYELYSFKVIPLLGEFIAKDRDAYEYLVESIKTFPNQRAIEQELITAGFVQTGFKNLSGGIVSIHTGTKPTGDQ